MNEDKEMREEFPEIDLADSGHTFENRQEIYYNDNVGGRAVFVDAKEHHSPDEPVIKESILQERDKNKTPILSVRDLGIDFGGLTAVDGFNIDIGRTEIAGLIGPNGAGKTTIFNMLTKVYEPTRGEIIFNGKSTKGMNTVDINRAGMARTFQNIRLFDKLTVEENIKVALHHTTNYGLLDGMLHTPKYRHEEFRIRKEAMKYLKIFGMTKAADYKAGSLPYGAQRRLEIMRALATKPKLLLLDGRRGHEPIRDCRAHGYYPVRSRQIPDSSAPYRARHESGNGHMRGHSRTQLRPHHSQGQPGGDPEQSEGNRGLSR